MVILTCMSSCIRQRFSFTNNAPSDPQHNISIGCVFLTLGNFVNWVTAVRFALQANTLKLKCLCTTRSFYCWPYTFKKKYNKM